MARLPKDIRAAKCVLCSRTFHGVGEVAMRAHHERQHAPKGDGAFHAGYVEWRCRVCYTEHGAVNAEEEDVFEDEEEMLEQMREAHRATPDQFQVDREEDDEEKREEG